MALLKDVPVCHILAVLLGSLEIVLFGGVIFGWHSVVYVYKDVGYFSEHCGSVVTPPDVRHGNISFHPRKPPHANNTVDPSSNITYGTPVSRSNLQPNSSTPDFLQDGSSEQKSIRFDQLSCKEQMAVRAEEGGTSRVCASQDEQFYLIFSLATGINGMLSFPSGILYDRLGTRISRIISIVCFLGGQLFLIFASPAMAGLLYPGFIGLVYGGYQILLTNLQLGGLIPQLRSTIMSLYSGSYDTSSAIFLLFKAAHEGGVSINTMFAVQASLYFLIFTSSTFLLLPKTKIPNPLPPNYRLRSYLCQRFLKNRENRNSEVFDGPEWTIDARGSVILTEDGVKCDRNIVSENSERSVEGVASMNNETSAHNEERRNSDEGKGHTLVQKGLDADKHENNSAENDSNVDGVERDTNHLDQAAISQVETKATENVDTPSPESEVMIKGAPSTERKTFRQVACSPLFLTDLVWMCSQRLRSWIFVGMFNPWITRLACGDRQLVSHYTSVYAGLQFFGILTAPLSGRLMDRKIKGAEKYGNPRHERLHAAIASFVLNSSVSVVLTIGTLIPVLEVQYATFVLHCLHRSFLYGPNSAFVANAFPSEHFGKLFGITLTVSAIFSCVQYPLFLIMQGPLGGDPFYINVFLLVLMLISFIHPIYIWRYLQKKVAKRIQEEN